MGAQKEHVTFTRSVSTCVLSCFCHVWLFVTLRTVALQAPLFRGFSREEYWSGLPTPVDLPNPGIKPVSLMSPALASAFFITSTTWKLLQGLKVKVKLLSHVWLFGTPWTVAYQASLSMGFSRQVYWSGLPFPSPGHVPVPGIKPRSPALQAYILSSEPAGSSGW